MATGSLTGGPSICATGEVSAVPDNRAERGIAFGIVGGDCQRSGFVAFDADRFEEAGDDVRDGSVVGEGIVERDDSAE